MIDEYDIYFSSIMSTPKRKRTRSHRSAPPPERRLQQDSSSYQPPILGGVGHGKWVAEDPNVEKEAEEYIEEKHKKEAAATGVWGGRKAVNRRPPKWHRWEWGRVPADENVDEEAEEYIEAKHRKFNRRMSSRPPG